MTDCLFKGKRILCSLLFLVFLLFSININAQQKNEVKGQIKDERGQPIPSASIIAKNVSTNFTAGAQCDSLGVFKFTSLPVGGPYSFTASCIGYETQTLSGYTIKEATITSIIIKLNITYDTLSNVVSIGYANTTKRKITSSIASVKMDNIDKGVGYDPIKMLQGRTTGVNIMSTSGIPGSNPTVIVRGVGSISGSSSPLYVIDGIITDGLPNLNPNDIESMDVLKDASSAAIYGSRANNGVIIIKTKSGKAGKTIVTYSSQIGWGKVSNDITMANSSEYIETMQEALKNYNTQKGTSLKLYVPNNIEEFNWVKAIARNSSKTIQHNVSVSGGTDKTTFFGSFGYFKQDGYLQKSDYEQYSFRTNLTHKINKVVKVNINLGATYANQNLLEETSTSLKILRTAREEQPWYSPYDSSGNYKVNGTKILRHNPLMLQNEETWFQKSYQGLGGIGFDITPIKGFKYTPSINVYASVSDEKKKLTENHAARATSAGWGAIQQNRNEGIRYVIDNVFSYEKKYPKLNYSILAGHEYSYRSYDNFGAYSDNYLNNAFPSSSFDLITSGTNIYASGVGNSSVNLESYFTRVTLDYDAKYLMNLSFRRDGSSKFSQNNRYGNFPAFSFAWLPLKENFFPQQNVISDLKIRVSAGKTGSVDGIGNFDNYSLVRAGNSYNGSSGLVLSRDAQDLTWEEGSQFDIGIDASFLNGRIKFTADYFHQTTDKLLYQVPIQTTSGFSVKSANAGNLSKTGFEMDLTAKILQGKFKWDMSANFTSVQNKLNSLGTNLEVTPVPSSGSNLLGGVQHALIIGKPISAYYMYNMVGIYQNDADVPSKLFTKGVRAGDVQYEDINGDGDITDVDRKYVGKTVPDLYGGITNTISFKNFDLNIFSQFSFGGKIIAAWQGINGVEGTDNPAMSPASVYFDEAKTIKYEQYFNVRKFYADNYWSGAGTSNTIPRPVRTGIWSGYSTGYNSLTSTRYLEDGSYFKFKTITLGYTLPAKVLAKLKGIQSFRVYITAENLFTITKYSGFDPEASYAGSPGDSNYGVDFGLQPTLRTFSFGVNVKF